MKRLLVLGVMLPRLTACGGNRPAYTDNGNPGQIQVLAYFDDNANGKMDSGEMGVQSQLIITQEVSCPPQSQPSWVDTDANGAHTFEGLKPGKYCVGIGGDYGLTTKGSQEVYVSSDATTPVYFGLIRP